MFLCFINIKTFTINLVELTVLFLNKKGKVFQTVRLAS